MSGLRPAAPLAAALVLAGCLDPRVSDEPGPPGLLLPAGSPVPSAHDDSTIDRQIDGDDGVDDEVPLIHGFAGGEAMSYWDFGTAPAFAAPLFLLVRARPGGVLEPIDHPGIIDTIPGESGYSPFRAVLALQVTELYQGELMTSFAAVQEAEDLGLVEKPVLEVDAVDSPVVARGVTLESAGGAAPAPLFWKGMSVDSYDLGRFALAPPASLPAQPRYALHREGDEPLSEVLRGGDITGDGDRNDTNDVFAARAGQPEYSPACRTIEVSVARATPAIDTFADETMSDISAATDLFDPDAVAGTVVGYVETDDLRNCPQPR